MHYRHLKRKCVPNPSRFPVLRLALSSFLRRLSPPSAMLATSTDAAAAADDSLKFGFQRQDMYSENLSGTVNLYDRHVFLCYKTHQVWPSRVESSDSHPLPKLLAGALKARKKDITVKTLLTICEGREGTELSDGDILIFPEMIKYRGLKESDIDNFVDQVLVKGKPWSLGAQEVMTGSHVFVCAHNSRDKRCGVCGPALIGKFKEEAELRGLKDQVFVTACSHVGGHKYAGNLIIYGAVQDGKVSGHWYGYVTPNDVGELLDQHIGKGEIIERIWRGQMGVAPVKKADKAAAAEPTLPNGNHPMVDEKASNTKQETDNDGGCCQAANGISCCRDEPTQADEKGETTTVGDKLGFLTRKWEQREIFTATAAVAAAAVVAYSFYKRSR